MRTTVQLALLTTLLLGTVAAAQRQVPARLHQALNTPPMQRTGTQTANIERAADEEFLRQLRGERQNRNDGPRGTTTTDAVTRDGVWVSPDAVALSPGHDPRPSICLRLNNEEAALAHRISREVMAPDQRNALRLERAFKTEVRRACYRWARDQSARSCETATARVQTLARAIAADDSLTISTNAESLATVCPAGGTPHQSCSQLYEVAATARGSCDDAAALARLADEPAPADTHPYRGLL